VVPAGMGRNCGWVCDAKLTIALSLSDEGLGKGI